MRREIVETGKTVDSAIESACVRLGCDRDSVEWEIVDLPKKTFLGLKTIPAKVKVWIEEPDEPAKPERRPAPKREQPVQRAEKPKAAAPDEPKEQKPEDEKRRPEKKTPDRPASQPAAVQAKAAAVEPEEKAKPAAELTAEQNAKAETAMSWLKSVCEEMKLSAEFSLSREEEGVCISIKGEGLGAVIGRRGETLDAMQYLTGLVANRQEGDYLRITVDCGDYRTRRRSTLEALARKLSSQVLKTGSSKTLEPMNPFERRIIHATVGTIEGVNSTSVGEEPNRRVVISSLSGNRGRGRPDSREGRGVSSGSGERRPQGGGRDRRPPGGGGGNRGRRPGGNGPSQGGTINTLPQKPPAEPRVTPEATTTDKPLYTKLDLE